MAQAIVGVPVTQSRNTPGRASGSCEFKDTSGTEIILFTLWRLPSAEEGSRYLEAELKTATGVRGGTAEKIPNLGDEAYYLSTTWSLYVRKGVAWFSFGYPFIKKEVLIDLARKVAPKL